MQLTHGSLFAGIGGFDLGFQRAGIKTVWQVEIDPFCRKVLEKNFPDAERLTDIRECCPWKLWSNGRCFECGRREWVRWVDVVTGGFPCQDVSAANANGAGLDGERSGLWREMWRIVRDLRPRFIVVENVSNLLNRGIDRVLGDLAKIGYDAEWECLPACAFGAPHIRSRVYIVAYPKEQRTIRAGLCEDDAPTIGRRRPSDSSSTRIFSDASGTGLPQPEQKAILHAGRREEGRTITKCDWWATEPNVGRVANGIPARVDRIKGLGNSVVPQIAEWIGRRIIGIAA